MEPKTLTPFIMTLLLTACQPSDPPREFAREKIVPSWFTESAADSGLEFTHRSGHDGRRFRMPESMAGGAALFDMDGDGLLDVYLVQSMGEGNRLFRNLGDTRFRDVSAGSGADDPGYGMGVATGDYDGDGRVDVFVANDRMPDQLWINLGEVDDHVRFEDQALVAGCAMDEDGRAKAGMGVASMDVDDDGDADLLVVNFSDESDSFFRNEGAFFTDATAVVGLGAVSRPFTRFGVGLADFDNDGHVDLYEAAGRVARQSPSYGANPYAEPNLLLRGTSTGRFEEVEPRGGATELAAASRAAAFGDLDNDGGVDVVVVNRDGPVHLLQNAVRDRGHWITFRLVGPSGSDALGARLSFQAGERTITRTVRTAYSYCAANDPRVHVGLGTVNEVRQVTVAWPDGTRQGFGDLAVDQIVTLAARSAAGLVE